MTAMLKGMLVMLAAVLCSCTASREFGVRLGTDAGVLVETGANGSVTVPPDGTLVVSGPARVSVGENQSTGLKTVTDGVVKGVGFVQLGRTVRTGLESAGKVLLGKEVTKRAAGAEATERMGLQEAGETARAEIAAEAAAAGAE